MPRTKQVRKKSSLMRKSKESLASSSAGKSNGRNNELLTLVSTQYESIEEFLQAFDIYYSKKVDARKEGYEQARELVKEMFDNILSEIPTESQNELFTESALKLIEHDQNKDPNPTQSATIMQSSTTSSSRQSSRAQKHLELFEFKKPKTPMPSSRKSSRKRSSSASAVIKTAPYPKENFKTPQMTRRITPGSTITPKVYSDTPMSVMRRPQQGEVAVSMSGSPLMVGPYSHDDVPTVNVPLIDGRVFSIMPEPGAPPPDLPEFDSNTKKYLQTLRAHLEILAPNSP